MADEHYKQYIIPENISDGSKWRGFKKRNIFEGVIMAAIVAIPLVLLMGVNTTTLSVAIFTCGPLLILGVVGISGDSFFVFAKNAVNWWRKKGPMLYNTNPRILEESPLEAALSQSATKTNIVTKIEEMATKRTTVDAGKVLVEGEDFNFMDDADESDVLAAKIIEETDSLVLTFEKEFASPFTVTDEAEDVLTSPAAEEKSEDLVVAVRSNIPNKGEEDLF